MFETFFVLTTGFLREYHSVLTVRPTAIYSGGATLRERDFIRMGYTANDTDALQDMIRLVPEVLLC